MIAGLVIQTLLFTIFGVVTAVLSAIIGPTYDGLLVTELSPSSLYPALSASSGGGFLATAVRLSEFLVAHLVDPVVPVIALGVGILYLARATLPELAARTQSILPRLVFAVVLANFSLPVASALLGVAGAGYPEIANFDGGAWRTWNNLGGFGMLGFSWDNGALAFVLTLMVFSLLLLLVLAVALRDALLGVLLVLLPIFTLVYPIPTLAPLAKRAWLMFGQLAFLPWLIVIPLELAVGTSSEALLVGYLSAALAAPTLLALNGAQLPGAGFSHAGGANSAGLQRGLSAGSSVSGSWITPLKSVGREFGAAGPALRGAAGAAAAAPMPLTLPLFAGELLGHSAGRLFRHVPGYVRNFAGFGGGPRFPRVHEHPLEP